MECNIKKQEIFDVNNNIKDCIIDKNLELHYVKIWYTYGFNKIGRKEFLSDTKENMLEQIRTFLKWNKESLI